MFQGRNFGPRAQHCHSVWTSSALLCLLLQPLPASALSSLSLRNISLSDPSTANDLGLDLSSLQDGFSTELSQQSSSEYLRRLGNAVGFTQAGLSGDYGSSFEHFIASASAGLGYQNGYAGVEEVLSGKEDLDSLGAFSAQAQLSLGFRFHNEQRSRYYLSFASSSFSRNSLELESWGWGGLWQYDLFLPRELGGPLVSWMGLRGGVGFRWNQFRSQYSQKISNLSFDVESPSIGSLSSQRLSLRTSVDGSLSSEARVMSFPLELGTAFQWFRILTLYGLLGLDANLGTVQGSVRADGPVKVSLENAGESEAQSAPTFAQADLQYYAYKEAKPEAFTLRALLGLQFELGKGSVFLQYQRGSLSESEAAALGFRAFY